MVSCGEDEHLHDEDKYDASIAIMSPAEGAEVTVGEVAHVHVDFTRPDNKIIHNVKIEVLREGAVIATLKDEHTHEEGSYSFHGDGFTPEMHGTYVLRATTTNDAGEEAIVSEVNFTAAHGGHSGEYKVMIDIVKPGEDATVAINTALEVEVTYTHETAGERIHNVLIDIIDSEGKTVGTLIDDHAHSDLAYTFTSADAWTPSAAGNYTLRAMTTDANKENMNMMMRAFKVE